MHGCVAEKSYNITDTKPAEEANNEITYFNKFFFFYSCIVAAKEFLNKMDICTSGGSLRR